MSKYAIMIVSIICLTGVYALLVFAIYRFTARTITDTVKIDSSTSEISKEINFSGLRITPGSTTKYELYVDSYITSTYSIELDFNTKETKGLENYIYFEAEGEDCYEGGILSDFLKGRKHVFFNTEMENNKEYKLTFYYSMDKDVDNDAMGKSVDFSILVKMRAI